MGQTLERASNITLKDKCYHTLKALLEAFAKASKKGFIEAFEESFGKALPNQDSGTGTGIKTLAGDSAPAVKKSSPVKETKETNPNVKTVIDHYHASFVARFKSPPPLNGAKCGAIAKKLLAGRTLDEAKWLVTEHLSNPPDFYEGKNLYGLEHVLASAQTLLARRAKATGAVHDR